MAKKNIAKVKPRQKKQSRRTVDAALRRGSIRRRPRQASLAGMEDARIKPLDDIAATIAENREDMNKLRADDAGHLQTALGLMRRYNRTSWRAHGVELVRVPGEEKLRVRTTKAGATAETEDEGPGALVAMDRAADEDEALAGER